jgi:hypothetical protein
VITGPNARVRRGARGRLIEPIDSIRLTVTDTGFPIVRLNDHDFSSEPEIGDTIEDVRDRLLTLLIDSGDSVTFTPSGTNAIDLEADGDGVIWNLGLTGPIESSLRVLQDPVLLIEGSASVIVQIQAYTRATDTASGASSILSRVQAALMTPDIVATLYADGGISILDIGSPIDLSEISGASWTGRASMDLELSLPAVWTRLTDWIETAGVVLTPDL